MTRCNIAQHAQVECRELVLIEVVDLVGAANNEEAAALVDIVRLGLFEPRAKRGKGGGRASDHLSSRGSYS